MTTAKVNVDECVVLLHGLVRTDASLKKNGVCFVQCGLRHNQYKLPIY